MAHRSFSTYSAIGVLTAKEIFRASAKIEDLVRRVLKKNLPEYLQLHGIQNAKLKVQNLIGQAFQAI